MSPPMNWPLGDYLIAREIDRGQFGTVWQATHPAHGAVALKLILRSGIDSDEKVEAERHGAVLQQRFSRAHTGLVPEIFEHLIIDDYYAVAMELVRGEPLTSPIARGPLAAHRAAGIGLAIATFLEKAHQFTTEIEGLPEIIVHGDLKPAHVLLIADGTIRVLDFGIAKALAARKPVTTNKWGSIDYASPERLESGHVNEHADFWSLGVILFEMAAGYRPYRQYEGSPSRLESAIRRQEPRAALPAGVDPALVSIVAKLLSPQPELRYQTAAAIVIDLTDFIDGRSTIAAAEHALASQATIRLTPDTTAARAASVPTEPLPRRPGVDLPPPLPPYPPLLPGRAAGSADATAGGSPRRRRHRKLVFVGKTLLAIALVAFVAAEGMGLVRAERFRDEVSALDASDIGAARTGYRTIRGQTPLGLGAMRVRGPLRDRLIELADRTILEFRTEAPALSRAQWEQTLDCLDLASEVAPGDAAVAARRRYVQGRLAWIRARNRAGVDEAIRLLRDSARLDPASPDPYLGLATIFAYSTRDLPALTDAIRAAEQRGYVTGRRERAELGDLHKVLADRSRARARTLDGDERVEQLQAAAADYAKCVEYFDGLHLGDSEASVGACRSRLRTVTGELDRVAPSTETEAPTEPAPPADAAAVYQ